MKNFEQFASLYKDLISEDTSNSSIKFLPFEPEEIVKYKKLDEINIIRPIDQLSKYNVGDYVKTEWGRVFKIQDSQLYSDISDWEYLSTLSLEKVEDLAKRQCSFKSLKLIRVVKKDTKRFFYDMEFDETHENSIYPISIGIVDQEGNELYLINKEYNWNLASQWLKIHVYPYVKDAPDRIKVNVETMKTKILQFLNPGPSKNIKLYGYYSAYDHVCFCKLFGTMNDLPDNLPKYTIDLQQLLDYFHQTKESLNISQQIDQHNPLSDAKFNLQLFKAIKEKFNPKYL